MLNHKAVMWHSCGAERKAAIGYQQKSKTTNERCIRHTKLSSLHQLRLNELSRHLAISLIKSIAPLVITISIGSYIMRQCYNR